MYVFNVKFFRDIYKTVNVKRNDILKTLDVAATTYDYWYQSGDMPVVKLLELVNEYHVPVSCFIIPEIFADRTIKTPVIRGVWYEVKTDLRKLGYDLTQKGTVSKICHKMGCSTKTFYDVFRSSDLPSGLSVATLLRYMNNVAVYPGDYIIDENSPIAMENGLVRRETNLEVTLRQNEEHIRRLEAEVLALRNIIRNIHSMCQQQPPATPCLTTDE